MIKIVKEISFWLYLVLKNILKSTWSLIKLFYFVVILKPLELTKGIYFGVFEMLLVFLKKFGIIGELIFTIYGIVWLMWPIGAAWYTGMTWAYLPGLVATGFLIVLGKKSIEKNN